MGAVDEVSDANNVQAVELVVDRDDECAVVRTHAGEAVRGEKCSPFIVVPQVKVGMPVFKDETYFG